MQHVDNVLEVLKYIVGCAAINGGSYGTATVSDGGDEQTDIRYNIEVYVIDCTLFCVIKLFFFCFFIIHNTLYTVNCFVSCITK